MVRSSWDRGGHRWPRGDGATQRWAARVRLGPRCRSCRVRSSRRLTRESRLPGTPYPRPVVVEQCQASTRSPFAARGATCWPDGALACSRGRALPLFLGMCLDRTWCARCAGAHRCRCGGRRRRGRGRCDGLLSDVVIGDRCTRSHRRVSGAERRQRRPEVPRTAAPRIPPDRDNSGGAIRTRRRPGRPPSPRRLGMAATPPIGPAALMPSERAALGLPSTPCQSATPHSRCRATSVHRACRRSTGEKRSGVVVIDVMPHREDDLTAARDLLCREPVRAPRCGQRLAKNAGLSTTTPKRLLANALVMLSSRLSPTVSSALSSHTFQPMASSAFARGCAPDALSSDACEMKTSNSRTH